MTGIRTLDIFAVRHQCRVPPVCCYHTSVFGIN
uniref:Uncharacterized protein n=1 Tax=Anguilla anguilla TaxID=7936 RepID=A0A0E9VXW8_ANGAN